MSGHTGGNWRVKRNTAMAEIVTDAHIGHKVPIINWQGFDDSSRPFHEHLANAYLIAAAPTYHAASEKIVEDIKKAERGQGFGGCPFVIPADLIEDLLDAHRKAIA